MLLLWKWSNFVLGCTSHTLSFDVPSTKLFRGHPQWPVWPMESSRQATLQEAHLSCITSANLLLAEHFWIKVEHPVSVCLKGYRVNVMLPFTWLEWEEIHPLPGWEGSPKGFLTLHMTCLSWLAYLFRTRGSLKPTLLCRNSDWKGPIQHLTT